MAQENKPLYTLYQTLQADNYDVPDNYESFERTLTASGEEGVKNRQALYNSLKADNYDVPNTYESFSGTLFEPVTPKEAPQTAPSPARSQSVEGGTSGVESPVADGQSTQTPQPSGQTEAPKDEKETFHPWSDEEGSIYVRKGGKSYLVPSKAIGSRENLPEWAKAYDDESLEYMMVSPEGEQRYVDYDKIGTLAELGWNMGGWKGEIDENYRLTGKYDRSYEVQIDGEDTYLPYGDVELYGDLTDWAKAHPDVKLSAYMRDADGKKYRVPSEEIGEKRDKEKWRYVRSDTPRGEDFAETNKGGSYMPLRRDEKIYVKLRRGGKDFEITLDELNHWGGPEGLAQTTPGLDLRVYMQDPEGKIWHVDSSQVKDRLSKKWKFAGSKKEEDWQSVAFKAAADTWSEATKAYKEEVSRNAGRNWGSYAGGKEMRTVNAAETAMDDMASHFTRFDMERLMEEAWKKSSANLTEVCYGDLKESFPHVTDKEVWNAARIMGRQLSNQQMIEYARAKNVPRDVWEYFLGQVLDANSLMALMKGGARVKAGGKTGTMQIDEQAKAEFGQQHKGWSIAGTVMGMAADPGTPLLMAAGGPAARLTAATGARLLSKIVGREMAAATAGRIFAQSLAGRIAMGAASAGTGMASWEMGKEGLNQYAHGGHINPETGENEGYSAAKVLEAGGHGAVTGVLLGPTGVLIGNVAKGALRGAELSTLEKTLIKMDAAVAQLGAETLIFAREDLMDGEKSFGDIIMDNGAMALGFGVHSHGKRAIEALGEIMPYRSKNGQPLTAKQRAHNLKSFTERWREHLDAPDGLELEEHNLEEIRRAGYRDLYDLASKEAPRKNRAKDKEAARAEAEDGKIAWGEKVYDEEGNEIAAEIKERGEGEALGFTANEHNQAFDGYNEVEALFEDPNVSEETKRKVAFYVLGKSGPLSSVMSYRRLEGEDGSVTIQTLSSDGSIVTSRTYKNRRAAEKAEREATRQVELNTIDIGEKYMESQADASLFRQAVENVAPGADPGLVADYYNRAKNGEELPEAHQKIVEGIDEWLNGNASAADGERPQAVRERIKRETGYDIDDIIRKEGRRSAREQELLEAYVNELFPENARGREDASVNAEQARQLRIGASEYYDEGARLFEEMEEGDPDAIAKIEAANNRMEQAKEAFEEAFGEDADLYISQLIEDPYGLATSERLTEGQREAVVSYINALAAIDGIREASADAAEEQIEQARQAIEVKVNKESGMIMPVVMKDEGKTAYVVSGRVTPLPDGSGIDKTKTDDFIIIYNPETGECEATSADFMERLEAPIDPAEELSAAVSEISARHEAFDNGLTDGITDVPVEEHQEAELPELRLNDEFTILDESGFPIRGSITAEIDEDGTIEIYTEEPLNGKMVNRLTPEEFFDLVDTYNGQILKAPIQADSNKEDFIDPNQEEVNSEVEAENRLSSLAQVPLDEAGNPMYDEVEPDLAWDAIVEQSGGDEEIAAEAIADELADRKKVLSDAEKALKKIEEGKPEKRKAGDPAPTMAERIAAKTEAKKALADAQATRDKAQKAVDHWKSIASTLQRRQEAQQRAEREEARRQAEARAAEEARLQAEREEQERLQAEREEERARLERERQKAEAKERRALKKIDETLAKAYDEVKDMPDAVERLHQLEPETIEEAAAFVLAANKLLWSTRKEENGRIVKTGLGHGMKQETGYGEEERRKLFGLFASAEKGGVTLQRLAEDPMQEVCERCGIPYDNQDAMRALLDVLHEAATVTDIRKYIQRRRAAQALAMKEAEERETRRQEEKAFYEEFGIELAQYEAYRDHMSEEAAEALEHFDESDYFSRIADEMAEREAFEALRAELGDIEAKDALGNLEESEYNAIFEGPSSDSRLRAENDNIKEIDRNGKNENDSGESKAEAGGDIEAESQGEVGIDGRGSEIQSGQEPYQGRGTEENADRPGIRVENGPQGSDRQAELGGVQRAESRGDVTPTGARFEDSGIPSHSETKEKEKREDSLGQAIAEAEKDVEQNPTEKQKLAGNYKKGHVKIGEFDVSIENPAGSVREGRDADGKEWRTTMQNTYGYIRGTKGVDGDHIDVYLSRDIEGWNGNTVVIVDQYNPDGTFDEHKVMLGFNSMDEAKGAYLSNYEEGWENGRRLVFTTADLADFEKWIESSHRKTKAYHEYKIAENGETQANRPVSDNSSDIETEPKSKLNGEEKAKTPSEVEKRESGRQQGLADAAELTVDDIGYEIRKAEKYGKEWDKDYDEGYVAGLREALALKEEALRRQLEEPRYQEIGEALKAVRKAAGREYSYTTEEEKNERKEELRQAIERADAAFDRLSDKDLQELVESQREVGRMFELGGGGLYLSRTRRRLDELKDYERGKEVYNEATPLPAPTSAGKPRKAKMTDFAGKDKSRPTLTGVHHDSATGMAQATDTEILIADRSEYNPAYADKTVDKKGNVIEGRYPDCMRILPQGDPIATCSVSAPKVADTAQRLREAVKSMTPTEAREAVVAVRLTDTNIAFYRLEPLANFFEGMNKIGGRSVEYFGSQRPLFNREVGGFVAVMPVEGERATYSLDLSGHKSEGASEVKEPSAGYRRTGRSQTGAGLFDWRNQPGQQSLLDLMEMPEREGERKLTSPTPTPSEDIFGQMERIGRAEAAKRELDREKKMEAAGERADAAIDEFQERYAVYRKQVYEIDAERERSRERIESLLQQARDEERDLTDAESIEIEGLEDSIALLDGEEDALDEQMAQERDRLEEELYGFYRLNNTEKDARDISREKARRAMAETEMAELQRSRKSTEEGEQALAQQDKGEQALAQRNRKEQEGTGEVKSADGLIRYKGYGHLPDAKRGEFAYAERVFTLSGKFSFTGSEKIRSRGDVAFMFRALQTKAIENLFVVIVDNDGRPHVVHMSMGGTTATVFDGKTVKAAYDAFGGGKVYILHNHPTGNLMESPQDQAIMASAKNILGEEVEIEGLIIDTTSGKYANMYSSYYRKGSNARFLPETRLETEELPNPTGNEVNIDVYEFDERDSTVGEGLPSAKHKIKTSRDVVDFIAGRRFNPEERLSYIVLNNHNEIVGNFHSEHTDAEAEGFIGEVTSVAVKYGGERVILYGNIDAPGKVYDRLEGKMKGGIPLLDVVGVKDGYATDRSGERQFYERNTEGADSINTEDIKNHFEKNGIIGKDTVNFVLIGKDGRISKEFESGHRDYTSRELADIIAETARKEGAVAVVPFSGRNVYYEDPIDLKSNIERGTGIRVIDVLRVDDNGVYSQLVAWAKEPEADYGKISVRKNIENGIEALRQLKDGKEEVRNAMQREDLEAYGGTKDITFYLGTPGIQDKGYKKGYGILHIGAKHGPEAVLRMLSIIAEGSIERVVPGNKTVVLTDGEYEAVLALTRNGQRQSWLLTGWDKLPTDENGKVSTSTVSTQANPTFSRDDLGAVIESSAKVIDKFENPKFETDKKPINLNEGDDSNVRFSIRQEPAPSKTGIGYKVFVLKDGKLYPPMVANPGGEATPVGVWLNADAAPQAGISKTGRPQVKAGGKGTQGGSGKLAYRPGWHLGEIPYALQFNRKGENGVKELFPANFVWAQVEYANDVDYQREAMENGMNANGNFQHSLAGLPRVPENGAYRYRTNPNPETDPWIITGAMKVNRILKPSEVDAMVKEAGREPQKRQEGAVTDNQVEALNKELKLDAASRQKEEEVSSAEVAEVMVEMAKATGVPVEIVDSREALAQRDISNGAPLSEGSEICGYTKDGKVYLNREAMRPDTPLHEYTHLWDAMVKSEKPELWERGKELLKETPEWNEVVNDPAYADIRGDEDAVASEVHSRLTGEEGARRMEDMVKEARKQGAMKTAEAVTLVEKIKSWLKEMFASLKETLGRWTKRDLHDLRLEEFNNMTLRDFAEGLDPNKEMRRGATARRVMEKNPMRDDYHTGVRGREDVKTFDEIVKEAERMHEEEGSLTYPDMSLEQLRKAKERGRITIYSSKPIEDGAFVTPSKMNAQDYAGDGEVYSKEVGIDDIAWIDESEGQLAEGKGNRERGREAARFQVTSGGRTPSLKDAIESMERNLRQSTSDDLQKKNDAMRAIGGNLSKLRQAMARQKEYDVATAKSIKDLTTALMKADLLDKLGNAEVRGLMAAMNSAIGKQDIGKQLERVMDIMIDNHLRNLGEHLRNITSSKGAKTDSRGIQVQGELDPDGQAMLGVFNKAKNLKAEAYDSAGNLLADCIQAKIYDAMDRMASANPLVAANAAIEFEALNYAKEYAEGIAESKASESLLRAEIKNAELDKKAGVITPQEYRQIESALKDAIRQVKTDRIERYYSLIEKMSGDVAESKAKAKEWKEQEKERVNRIHHMANSDMQGRQLKGQLKDTRLQKLVNSWPIQFGFQPLSTLDQILKMLGSKNPNGEGYLWNHFMRGWADSADNEQIWKEKYKELMDTKAAEIFGTKRRLHGFRTPYTYLDLYDYAEALPKATVEFFDGAEKREYELTQDALLYLYAVEKMPIGRATNRRMGISEEDMREIEANLDPKLKAFADWVQEELLPEMGLNIDEVHQRMFGAHMDTIENYFPFVRHKEALKQEVENGRQSQPNDRISVQTGAIKKRVPSVAVWDLAQMSFFDVLAKHVAEMCHWANFAELNRDMGTLLSYNRLKQQVMNMSSLYGSGKQLWKRLGEVSAITTDAYEPKRAKFDRLMVQGAKGVTMGKISLRAFTALKQTLSLPAFAGEVNGKYVLKDLSMGGIPAVRWAWKNLPNFRKRILSRTSGDYRLKETEYDGKIMKASSFGMLPNIGVDAWTIAVGAHGVYETKKAKYLRWGMDEARADRMAIQDAEIAFNKSQQSSEGPFMAPIQLDHTFLATTAMLFRNSSTSYTRMVHESARNLKRIMSGEVSKEYVAKQWLRLVKGEDETAWTDSDRAEAEKFAKEEIRRATVRNGVNLAVFGWMLPWLWRIGGMAAFLALSDNKAEMTKTQHDALVQSLFAPIEGLSYGDVVGEGLNMLVGTSEKKLSQLGRSNPMMSDIAEALKKLDKDWVAGVNDVLNILGGMALGINPQTLTDWTVAIIDAFDDRKTQKEMALLVARLLSVPQSQLDKLYLEELDMMGEEAMSLTPRELAERFAEYKAMREAPMTGWMRSQEQADSVRTKRAKKVEDAALEKVADRIQTKRTKELLEEYEAVEKEKTAARKLKGVDNEAYQRAQKELLERHNMGVHRRVARYRKDMKELTEKLMKEKDPQAVKELLQMMEAARDIMLEEVRQIEEE